MAAVPSGRQHIRSNLPAFGIVIRWKGGHAQVTPFTSSPQLTTLDRQAGTAWHCVKLTAIVQLFPRCFEFGANLTGEWESLLRLRLDSGQPSNEFTGSAASTSSVVFRDKQWNQRHGRSTTASSKCYVDRLFLVSSRIPRGRSTLQRSSRLCERLLDVRTQISSRHHFLFLGNDTSICDRVSLGAT